ncbi:MAG: translation initiation factor IF-2 [Lentisphaerae bacterium]|nr:translation initiation factor IF-2 [Lentisphaerota bacterium]
MRVHELAKEMGLSSKELLEKARGLGIDVKNHMSSLADDAVAALKKGGSAAVEAKAGVEPAPSKPVPASAKPAPAPAATAAPPVAQIQAAPAKPEERKPALQAAPVRTAPADAGKSRKQVKLRGAVVVKELADLFGVRPNQLIARLMQMNVLASINERLEFHVARDIGQIFGFDVIHERRGTEHHVMPRRKDEEPEQAEDRPEDMQTRPPVVTFLGHVDHGKTSLLDKIRNASVAAGESGGITQHIGAYTVDAAGRKITFLDTPGHAAFTAMRARGANLTDIAVIIVAADDGVMPQTREAIQHARASGVTLMVAINKIDLPGANADRVRQQLQGEGLSPEEWGGDTICSEVSAITGKGVDHLLEMILLQADMLDLKANPSRLAAGYVIEAKMEPGKGPTVNLLISSGTLKVGDAVLCGQHWGRIRALVNDHGISVKSAGPSTPVQALGLSGVPEAGAEFKVFANERLARSSAEQASQEMRLKQKIQPQKASLESLFSQLQKAEKIELRLVLKTDVQGSVEAISHALGEIKSDKVSLDIILAGPGNITVNDVMLASASNAVIVGFHVAKEPGVEAVARREGVEIRLHSIIYELLDEVREAMTGLLAPQIRETVTGHAQIRQVFNIGKAGMVAGCLMMDGRVTPKHRVRVKRGDEVLFEGSLLSLRHFQQDAAEIREAQECGIRVDGFSAFAENDVLEFYQVDEVKQTL